ncbi:hypothetical protein RxyAA322_30510 [Rubrobacter xylanophilus]|uniref:Uncharacterized protein n=1 Tax=Rubrobacter xylanophilus TaxID=49319 RepID=A0A510HQC7_9ACTN|nr:hypothetical protein [Rubrobacter xylanophilus]BBL81197.1 hypothetical protein RxyAA322_30510 [Rubrobacter xylanophilus]
MNLSVAAQLLSAVTNVLFVAVIAVGYYMMIRLYRQMVRVYDRMLHVTEAQRLAVGRPQVIVDDDYGRLPEVDVVVRNVSQGAAKEITFEFSAPVESSDGTVISDLAYFKDGLNFLAPNGQVTCHWDNLHSLLPFLEEKGLTEGITVTTRYKDLAGESYETAWTLNPFVYRDGRYVQSKGIGDVARGVEELVERVEELSQRLEALPDGRDKGAGAGRNAQSHERAEESR